jgi:isopenicillin N synthase-like dioxygenase
MLQEASNGYFPSTTHRVDNPGAGIDNVSRISIPFFLTPRLDVVLSERYTSGSYLDERLRLISR